ncbi:DUF3820 family protein [Reinekea marinisedimentorum]|uniref:DUF3820 family protein n=1 Tax=Reinekea marinisedimentorum TaxID=230495 RepID=A0A4R3I2L1_9GAMM|nr:DUF3820 family protein [Reinekea marinisedimentorum]TCS40007.1 hypothetical protein BCF53_111102 [Reinekea marinisedimentorum]
MNLDSEMLIELAHTTMPFGKYAGRSLIKLPEPYLLWFANKGFPQNRLGQLLALALLIRTEGLEHLLDPITKPVAPSTNRLQ